VQISGVVESCEVNPFSKSPEIQVSIICPDPDFVSVDPIVVTGNSANQYAPEDLVYNGDVETGFQIDIVQTAGPNPTSISVQVEDPELTYFTLAAGISSTMSLSISTLSQNKFVENIVTASGLITNLLAKIQQGSEWPTLKPGLNHVAVVTDQGLQNWTLTYYERYGGL
jgi:hypothetical protein